MTVSADASGESRDRALREAVVAALRAVHDPELPVNIYDLGLIYDLRVDGAAGAVEIRMTLTAPNCPMAEEIVADVRRCVSEAEGVRDVRVELVWEPAWSAERMTDAARLELLALGVDPNRPGGGASAAAARLTIGRTPT